MTALEDALGAAQSRTIAALGKQYVRGAEPMDDEAVRGLMHGFGMHDDTGITFLLCAWKILREQGEQAPGEQTPREQKREPATEPQLKFIRKLCDEKAQVRPDEAGLTKDTAHEIIESLQAGSYDSEKWAVPF